MVRITVLDKDGSKTEIAIYELPTECPLCHKGIDARFVTGYYDGLSVQAVCQCPRSDCHAIFIGYYYDIPTHPGQLPKGWYTLRAVAPRSPADNEFGSDI